MEMLSLEEALSSLEEEMSPFPPSKIEEFACILQKCRKERNLTHALRLHASMRESGLETHVLLGNCLVATLAEVGSMCHAQQVFDRLVYRDQCSWNSLITGYVKCGESKHALALYQKMQENESLHPSAYAFVALLKACTMLKDLERGHKIHAEIVKKGLLERNVFLGSSLVNMYAKCGYLSKAVEVFDKLLVRSVVLWNALIAGYVDHGYAEEALQCFIQMQNEGIFPDAITLVCSLKACGSMGATNKGREIHADIARKGLLERDIFIGNTLVDMYAKCGSLAKAQELFDNLPARDIVSWNALIAGYVEHGQGEEALICFEQMLHEGISPDAVTLVCSLKACASIGATVKGTEIHDEITRKGLLETDAYIGSALVDMYVKCGLFATALEVFDRLPCRDVVSWNALIAGHAEHGSGEEALECIAQMQHEGVHLDSVTFVCSLKACSSIGATFKGQDIHAEIAKKGLERDLFVGSTLVDMYAKCGLLAEAQEVFDELPSQIVVAWNALIAGYIEHGHGEKALNCLERMQKENISWDAATLVSSLKACGSIRATVKGQEIHAEMARKGFLERDAFVDSTLVDMYAKCGLLAEAQGVFDKLLVQDVVSWTALIAGYVEHAHAEEALSCFEQMQDEGISPGAVTIGCSLKACGNIGAIDKGQEIHAKIVQKGLLDRDIFIGSSLVDMYAKCGSLTKAHEVFENLPVRDVVSWTALIIGYAEHEAGEDALNCFEQMQHENVSPGVATLVCTLKACGSICATVKGREIHAEIARKGLERELLIGNTLVDMYSKCGSLEEAQKVFDKISGQDVFSWTALIAGYAEHGGGEEALKCFKQMQLEGVSPSAATFVSSLKACGSIGAMVEGYEIHAEIARKGLERESLVGNTLVDMYAKCGLLTEAQEVFDKVTVRIVVSWNALISGYVELNNGKEAINCFEEMQQESVSPDVVTLVSSLKACGSTGAIVKGQEIHAETARKGLEREHPVGNTLVDMYAKCGSLATAQTMFDKLPARDVVSWTALIAGYVGHGNGEKALNCFELMQHEGVVAGAVTLVCGLKACGSVGATVKGRKLHVEIASKALEREILVGNSLVDMYSKCGLLATALEVFDKLPVRDVVSWNALIAGYAQLGESEMVFHIFDRMIVEGTKPNLVTFISVLNVCSHAGLLDKGQLYFDVISNEYGFIPTLEHYTCMVDLLGRAGHIDKAIAMIIKMPLHPGVVVWHTVLGACRKWGNVELGRHAFEHAMRLDEKDSAAYVCMSNIYADAALQEGMNKVEAMRVEGMEEAGS